VRRFNTLDSIHKGEIKCLLVENIFNQFFVISGSADRMIKIWDTEPKTKNVVQTLSGHAGTILCLVYSNKSDTLFSGSVDKSIRIWK
jgi:WD40 repeat protein